MTVLALLVMALPVGAWACSTPSWYNCNWLYRQNITIDHTKVAGYQSNFPVLISLPSDSGLAAHALANGNDILFTASDGSTRLSHQIASYSSSTGALQAWVMVPSVSSSSNTVIYMYYGNSAAANQQNAAGVWSNGYRAVWHLDEGGTGARADSSGNGNSLKPRNYMGVEGTAGEIGGADSLNGAQKYLESTNNIGITGSSSRTITFWAKLANTNRCGMVGWGSNAMENEFEAAVRANAYFLWGYGGGNDWPYIASPVTNSWNYYAVTYDGDTARWYLNGTQLGSGFENAFTTSDSHVYVGYETDAGMNSVTYLNGMVDEVRVANTTRSSSWIQTEYNNEVSPSTFSALQAEQKVYDYSTCRVPTPPVAAFTGTPTSGKMALTVNFTDQSTNTPTAWAWDFGDSGTSTLQNPAHVYTAAGTYTVSLTATNGDGSNKLVKQNYITVTPKTPPVAAFTANVTTGPAPLAVAFTDQSTNTPTAWAWDFGDSGTSTLQNPAHVYTAAGTYTVKLTVTNADGSSTASKATYVTVLSSLPVAGFSGTPTSGKQPLTVTFTDQSTNTPTAWAWDFGDGATSQQQNPVHVYTTPGVYTVALGVSNAGGSDRMVKQNYITVSIDCGDSQSLVTSDGRTVACAAVSNDNGNLYVGYTGSPSFPLKQVDWAWGYQASNIPQTGGVPDPTRFPYTHVFATGEFSYAFPGVDISSVLSTDISYVVLSIHASTQSGDDAWAVDTTGAKSFSYRLKRVTISFSPPDALLSLPQQETSQTVTVTATNGASAVKGATVLFGTNFGAFANGMQAASAITDGSGRASVTLSSSAPGTATLTAAIDANGNGIIDPTEWSSSTTVEWLYPTTITLDGSPATIQLPDTTPASLAATVLDQDGFPMEGVPVTFTSAFSDGATTTRTTSTATTDGNGVATVTLSETTAGTATVTASYGTTASTAATVTWLADPSAATPATTTDPIPATTSATSP
ncbi:MAG TPA: DUF2341 domain-containing protein [Methanomicrobiales archaeon]|nr:DUF2341 domain-containing protein [Methanomicrobiales archaeon]